MSRKTKIITSQVMMPNQTNPNGNVHGGDIMKMMDSTAYAAARKYSGTNVVTARVDELEFHLPIMIGDLVICTAKIVYVGSSSMEIFVTVDVDELDNDRDPQRALSAFFTMVALDRNARPTHVPPMVLETPEEQAAFEEGKRRHEMYKERKKQRAQSKSNEVKIVI